MARRRLKMKRSPLPLEQQYERWLYAAQRPDPALHRISEIAWADGERIHGEGVTVCGRRGRWCMPGIFSRLGRPRCRQCCRALGLPLGDGAPYNDKALTAEQSGA